MDIQQLINNPVVQISAGVAFVVGLMLGRMLFKPSKKEPVKEDPRNHQIRELEADLRAVRKELEELQEAHEAKKAEFNSAVETMHDLRAQIAEREDKLGEMKGDLKGEMAKTRELRQELQDRASETIRQQVRASEAETELEVTRAGSEAVLSEINRLQEERKNLTDTMRQLEEKYLPEDSILRDDS